MNSSLFLCTALLLLVVDGRVFHHSIAPNNGTGITFSPVNGTTHSTVPPYFNSTGNGTTPCPFLNGTIIYANGTHFLVAASAPIGTFHEKSSDCPPFNGNTTTSSLNGTVLTTPSPYVNGSQPFSPNSTYTPFTNGTFGIYSNGTHFWLAQSQLVSNISHHTVAPPQNFTLPYGNVTLSPGNFTLSPGNYTLSPIYNVTMNPILNNTSLPGNGTIYSTLSPYPGNETFSLNGSSLQSLFEKKEHPVVINIIL